MRILAVTMAKSVAALTRLAVPTTKAKRFVKTVVEAAVAEVDSGSTLQQPTTQRRWMFQPLLLYGAARLSHPQAQVPAEVPARRNTEKHLAATTAVMLHQFVLTINAW